MDLSNNSKVFYKTEVSFFPPTSEQVQQTLPSRVGED